MAADKIIVIEPEETILTRGVSGIDAFVERLTDWAIPQRGGDMEIHARALANLIGITDTEAVKIANAYARDHGLSTITTRDFRQWLPTAVSAVLAEWKESINAKRKDRQDPGYSSNCCAAQCHNGTCASCQ